MKRSLVLLCLLVALAPVPAHAYTARQHRVIAAIREVAFAKGLICEEADALVTLAYRESRWNPTASNGTCLGVLQLTRGKVGKGTRWKSTRFNTRKAIHYIRHRYGTPRKALAHSFRYGWY